MKKLMFFVAFIIICYSLYAQNQIISKLKQPPPNKFGIEDLWLLELNNTTKNEIKGYVIGTLSEDKDGLIVEGRSKPFIIKPGRKTYTYNDFSDADIQYHNNRYKEILLRTGGAPEGDYTICIEIYSEEGEVIGIENCIYHPVRQLGNISLLTPADGDEANPEQPVIFSWTPLPDAKEYSLKIVELIGNQSPETALQQNPPFFIKDNLRTTQFQYPLTERKFQSLKSYAWLISTGNVESEIGLFTVKSSENISDSMPTIFRFTLVYPDRKENEVIIENFAGELEEFAKILIGDNGVKPGSVNRQTQGVSFGEKVNPKLINFFTTEESREFGEDILILTGSPTSKIVPCPPPGCGCTDKGGESCSCKH